MRRPVVACAVLVALAAGFGLGRMTSEEPDRRSSSAVRAPSPSSSQDETDGRYFPVLDWFAQMDERYFPVQGILGGTMRAWKVGFPASFERRTGDHFYVLFEDGHAVVTFRYTMTKRRFWKPDLHRQGDRVTGWGRGAPEEPVFVWEWVPPTYAPVSPPGA